jgi:hypothetical protein
MGEDVASRLLLTVKEVPLVAHVGRLQSGVCEAHTPWEWPQDGMRESDKLPHTTAEAYVNR